MFSRTQHFRLWTKEYLGIYHLLTLHCYFTILLFCSYILLFISKIITAFRFCLAQKRPSALIRKCLIILTTLLFAELSKINKLSPKTVLLSKISGQSACSTLFSSAVSVNLYLRIYFEGTSLVQRIEVSRLLSALCSKRLQPRCSFALNPNYCLLALALPTEAFNFNS